MRFRDKHWRYARSRQEQAEDSGSAGERQIGRQTEAKEETTKAMKQWPLAIVLIALVGQCGCSTVPTSTTFPSAGKQNIGRNVGAAAPAPKLKNVTIEWTYPGPADYFLILYRDKAKTTYLSILVYGSTRAKVIPGCTLGADYMFWIIVLNKGTTSPLYAYRVK